MRVSAGAGVIVDDTAKSYVIQDDVGVTVDDTGVTVDALKKDIKTDSKRGINAPDFSHMTPIEAMKLPELRHFRDATGFFPGAPLYETVYTAIREKGWTAKQLRMAYTAWVGRGYNPRSIEWFDWVENGVPKRNGKTTEGAPPAINQEAVERTRQEQAAKWDKPFVPPPASVKQAIAGLAEKMETKR